MIARNLSGFPPVTRPAPDLEAWVAAAADAVAPQWPIATFAARSPWLGLEHQSFDEVARWYDAWNGSALYPKRSHASAPLPEDARVVERVEAWLKNRGDFEVDPLLVEFCLNRLKQESPLPPPAGAEAQRWRELAATLPAVSNPKPAVVRTQAEARARHGEPDAQRVLETASIRWLKLFAGRDATAFAFGGDSLYATWRAEAKWDAGIPRAARRRLHNLPADADAALDAALKQLAAAGCEPAYLRAHLAALPGWVGMLRWQGREQGTELSLLTEYLALRVTLEAALLPDARPAAVVADDENGNVDEASRVALLHAWSVYGRLRMQDWRLFSPERARQCLKLAADFDGLACTRLRLELRERAYRRDLQRLLAEPAMPVVPATRRATAQVVFCIDVRSEPLRRALEAQGSFETFGFAGFFGLPIRTRGLEDTHTHAACPVILKPEREVGERAAPDAARRYRRARAALRHQTASRHRVKQDPLASLAMPEFEGPWRGLGLLWNSFAPALWRRRWSDGLKPAKPATVPEVAAHGDPSEASLETQAAWAAGALRGIGLTRDFAPLVVFTGHGSRSRNNPYEAKLLCGACGGAAGGFNARVLAAVCNDARIRARLAAQGIVIPSETVFTAAEHQTSLDEVTWLEEAPTAGPARAAFEALRAALLTACAQVRGARLERLPDPTGGRSVGLHEAVRRAEDWSETRPEWGLARNAAFIIGRRAWTRGRDLDGRAFLHGYRWEEDRDGSLLAGLIAGPVTVAQWINLQYYASTVAPDYQGSGSKATQTVTSGFGVMQGNGSDLAAGLPWQSVMADDRTPYHEAQRLLVVIEAPAAHVESLLATQDAFAQKVRNGWLLLTSFDPATGRWTDW